MRIYLPVKFELDWTKHFPAKIPEMKMLTHRQTHGYTTFESNLTMMVIYVGIKFEFDWTKHF